MTEELSVRDKEEVRSEEATRPGRVYRPDVDIFETGDSLVLRADVPGVDESTLTVHLDDGVLSLEGQVALQDYENLTPAYTEYHIGNYQRKFQISSDIDAAGIAARVTDGVLEVTFPKSAKARPRQIQVTSG